MCYLNHNTLSYINADNQKNLSELHQIIPDTTSSATAEKTRKWTDDSSAMQSCNYKGKNKSEPFILQYVLLFTAYFINSYGTNDDSYT